MHPESLPSSLVSGEINEIEVLASLPESFTEKYGRKLSVTGILAIVDHFGGGSMYIPRTPKPGSQLMNILTQDDLKVLCELDGGAICDIPSGLRLRCYIRNKRIVAMRNEGHSEHAVARHFGFSTRWIRKQMERHREYQGIPPAD